MISWAHRQSDDRVWVSTRAKHIVTADGEDTFVAGELRIYKNSRREVELAIFSNSSGSVKAGAGALEAPEHVLSRLDIPSARVLLTAQSPADPQLLKLLLISSPALSKDDISARMSHAKQLVPSPAGEIL